MNAYRLIIVAALALALSACTLLNPRGAPSTVYSPTLHAPVPQHEGTRDNAVPWQLVVQTPTASAALQTRRIVILPQRSVIEVYKDARWRDTAPAMVRDMLVAAFQDSGQITGVAAVGTGLRADFTLALDLRAFQVEFIDSKPHAVIDVTAKLISYRTSRAVAAHRINVAVPADSADAANVAQAMEDGLNQVLPQLAAWTLQEGSTHFDAEQPARPRVLDD